MGKSSKFPEKSQECIYASVFDIKNCRVLFAGGVIINMGRIPRKAYKTVLKNLIRQKLARTKISALFEQI